MKKITILLVAIFALFTNNTFAEIYELWIEGEQITDANCATYGYNPTLNTLTLNGSTYEVSGVSQTCIKSNIENLNINLISNNTLTSDNGTSPVLHLMANTRISGGGTLTVEGGYSAIFLDNCNLTINDATLSVRSLYFGICGNQGLTETLTINDATVSVTSYSGSICRIKALALNGVAITQPAGASFSSSDKAVIFNGAIVKDIIEIAPAVTTSIGATANNSVRLYPNPATNIVNIEAPDFEIVELINHIGQVIYSSAVTSDTLRINVTNLPAGTYFVKLKGNCKVVTEKLVLY